MTLQRARIKWPPSEYYFMSPDGEEWLEVSAESYHRAIDHRERAAEQLVKQLAGDGTMLPIRMTRGYLQQSGRQADREVIFDD
jgi:hypothetical protein